MIHDCLIRYHLKKKSGSGWGRPCYRKNQAVCPQYRCRCKEAAQGGGRQVLAFRAQSSSLFCAATSPFRISNDSRSSIVAKFRAGFISHSGLKIEREISHTFEIRNFPQRNIPVAKSPPPVKHDKTHTHTHSLTHSPTHAHTRTHTHTHTHTLRTARTQRKAQKKRENSSGSAEHLNMAFVLR